MPGRRKSKKPETPNKRQNQVKQQSVTGESTEPTLPSTADTSTNQTEEGEEGGEESLVQDPSNTSGDADFVVETGCGACTQLLAGSVTQFMTSEKFLEKYPERIEGFNLYDYSCHGYINSEDLGSALAAVGYIVCTQELATVCEHLNIKPGTRVDFRLFSAVIAHQIMASSDTQIMDAFRMFDREGRGTIDAKELKHITTVLGVQTDEEQIDDMVREVDVDGDGDIDFQEFVMMIRK